MNTSRVVEWREREVQVIEIPMKGVPEGSADAPPIEKCEGSYALVYAGHGRTDDHGEWSVSLPAISCLHPAPGGDRRPSVVATPTTDDNLRPFILAARTQGAVITIRSFSFNGEQATNVEFSWHCVVEGTLVQ